MAGKTPVQQMKALFKRGIDVARLDPLLFRYHEWRLARQAGGEPMPVADMDGVPLPSLYLMTLVAGEANWQGFLESGKAQSDIIADLVERNGGKFREAQRLLDFGCGCGRIARHIPKISEAALFGVDYNPRLVNWCAKNLTGTFARNQLMPPLSFPDGYFDAVWLLSVFTHLRLETQNAWLAELRRIVRPGGMVVITFHDENHPGLDLVGLSPETLLREDIYIYNDQAEGSNYISTFQTRKFTRGQFGEFFEVCEIIPSRETALVQAAAVLQRR